MKHLDLFSGIGGFALAAKAVWGDGYECVGFCEIDPYCQALLRLRFEGVPIYEDIRGLTADTKDVGWNDGATSNERETKREEYTFSHPIDLITGGFPCQPFSTAGKRKGTEDDRHLWPQMFRVINEFKPRWVLAENVRGILNIEGGMVFEQVCIDLESIGYEVQAFIIPACAVNAPHRRDRVWFVARLVGNSSSLGCGAGCCDRQGGHIQNSSIGETSEGQQERNRWQLRTCEGSGIDEPDVADKQFQGLQRQEPTGEQGNCGRFEPCSSRQRNAWNINWLEVATKFCRMDDGLPVELDGFKLSKARHRVERLKALGNAIVPAVAVEIMKAMKAVDDEN